MFKELVPILRNRAVLMTATALDDDQIRVNVVPKKMKDGDHDALTTPLSVTGTAKTGHAVGVDSGWIRGVASSDEELAGEGEGRHGRRTKTPGRGAREVEDGDKIGTGEDGSHSECSLAKPAEPARPHRRSLQASSICRRHPLPLPPPR